MEELIHALQYLERSGGIPPSTDELLHMEFEAKIIGHIILGLKNGSAMWEGQDNNPPSDPAYRYNEWFNDIKQENMSMFNANGEFNWVNWQIFIKSFAINHDKAYKKLHNPNFIPTLQPTILFLILTP